MRGEPATGSGETQRESSASAAVRYERLVAEGGGGSVVPVPEPRDVPPSYDRAVGNTSTSLSPVRRGRDPVRAHTA